MQFAGSTVCDPAARVAPIEAPPSTVVQLSVPETVTPAGDSPIVKIGSEEPNVCEPDTAMSSDGAVLTVKKFPFVAKANV